MSAPPKTDDTEEMRQLDAMRKALGAAVLNYWY